MSEDLCALYAAAIRAEPQRRGELLHEFAVAFRAEVDAKHPGRRAWDVPYYRPQGAPPKRPDPSAAERLRAAVADVCRSLAREEAEEVVAEAFEALQEGAHAR